MNSSIVHVYYGFIHCTCVLWQEYWNLYQTNLYVVVYTCTKMFSTARTLYTLALTADHSVPQDFGRMAFQHWVLDAIHHHEWHFCMLSLLAGAMHYSNIKVNPNFCQLKSVHTPRPY